ncbi:MAG: T9SS type A sorting domain-containing protein [Bacteroidetes bacterium]|nr:T9SS type A sorting domain-containing protein [Bacteroidota bacterium]
MKQSKILSSKILFFALLFGLINFNSNLFGQQKIVSFNSGNSSSAMPEKLITDKGIEYTDVEYNFPGAFVSEKMVNYKELNQTFQFLNIEGFGKMTEVGNPAVPSHNDIIAVPKNAHIKIIILESESQILSGYYIHPALKPASERKGDPSPVFEMNEKLYNTDEFYPKSITDLVTTHQIRGNAMAVIQIHPVQFNPVTKKIRVYSKIKYRVVFEGLSKSFASIGNENTSHFTNSMKNIALNSNSIPDGVDVSKMKSGTRKDYIIITHSSFLAAADSLAKWKNQLGYSTEVVSKASWTVQQVKDSIAIRYNTWIPKPDYFLIIGDNEQVPGQTVSNFVTDLYYSCFDGPSDYVADMAKGRIPVTTPTEAMTVVQKIINYEKNPVNLPSFYNTAVTCAYFQDYDDNNSFEDRRFALTSEDIRNYLIAPSLGYTVNRVYKTDAATNPTNWNDGYYANSEPLPATLLKPTFAWDGDFNDINAQISAGTFFVLHRDHGYEDGWGDPAYDKTNIDALTNGDKLPVVFSINCLTGKFLEPECFSERFIRKANGGAVGVFCHAEVSYSGYNDALAIGMFDAIWPNPGMAFSYTGSGWINPSSVISHSAINTMGDVVNQGLYRMVETWGDDQYTHELLHYFGDPAMKMWTANPVVATATHQANLICGATSFTVNSSNCSDGLATIYYHGQLVGSTQLVGGVGTISFFPMYFTPENAILTISKNNYKPYVANIPVTGTCALPPNNQFVANTTVTCLNSTVTFTDQSYLSPTTWNWIFTPSNVIFVGGTNANSQNPQVQFTSAGNYNVELRTSNTYGMDTLVKNFYILAHLVLPDFTASDTSSCVGNQIVFSDASLCSPALYLWNFGLGATPATAASAGPHTITYNTSGPKTISLTVNGTITETKTNFININSGVSIPSFAQNFEGATFPPSGWTITNPDNGKTWERTTSAGGNGSSMAAAYINLYSYPTTGQIDELIGPSVDLSGLSAPNLTFKVAYAEYSTSYIDSLKVLISQNCGLSYSPVPIYGKTGANLATSGVLSGTYTPAIPSDWRTEIVDLSPYAGSMVTLKFVVVNGYGNNLYLDDINIINGMVNLSENEDSNSSLLVFPNPNNGNFSVEFNSKTEKMNKCRIYNSIGACVYFEENLKSSSSNKRDLNLSGFSRGLYLMEVEDNLGNKFIRKISIQ